MTKPVTRKLAVDCLLDRVIGWYGTLPCSVCKQPLLPGQNIHFDHIHADIFDGPHEYENLRPLHFECHKDKTARDIKANAKVKRLANPKPSRHPMKSSGRKLQSKPFAKRAK